MSQWIQIKLGEIVTLNYGKALKAQDRNAGSIPVYSSGGLTGWHDCALINDKGIIVGRKGTVGKSYLTNGPFWCIDTAYYILPNPSKYHFIFLFYLLKTLGLEELNEDSAVPGLNRDTAYSQILSLPPLTEQKAIASVLSSLDDKIDLLHRQNKTLESIAETLFRQWFVIDNTGKPVAVDHIIDFNPKRTLTKNQDATYLDMAGLSTDIFRANGYYKRPFSSGTKFTQRDTLLARITPCLENGKAAYIDFLDEKETGWGSTEFIVMRPKKEIHPLISYIMCRNPEFKEYAESCMEGSTGRQRVNLDHLKKFNVNLPAVASLRIINELLGSFESKLINNSQQIDSLEKLRDTLLPKLMSGEVRVQYAEEAISSVA
ncbi:restriction endonuclease subunit S [Serratia marcescens]|uniref:restriction endonuclease subunit S n=1 Tax=Serratia marcescens TaxID=615 RepID=UPI000E2E858D|nr:restriction endonuclease subunit S [Serratia marcescens]